jgi:hypothetical protein
MCAQDPALDALTRRFDDAELREAAPTRVMR